MEQFPTWFTGQLPDLIQRDRAASVRRGGVVIEQPWPSYDPQFVRAELERYERDHRAFYADLASRESPYHPVTNPNSRSIIGTYLDGVLSTFGWFLGACESPMNGFAGPPSKADYDIEWYLTRTIYDDTDRALYGGSPAEVYGNFEHWYVVGVYKSLRWIMSDPAMRVVGDPDLDPLAFF